MESYKVIFKIIFLILVINYIPETISQLSMPSYVCAPPTPGSSLSERLANAHLCCEVNTTGILCNTTVYTGHEILQHLPPTLNLKHCAVFDISPHCCSQFCKGKSTGGDAATSGGTCDAKSGACFCKPGLGVPNVCQLFFASDKSTDLSSYDNEALIKCRGLCIGNGVANKPAITTDGIVGYVCMCYSDPA